MKGRMIWPEGYLNLAEPIFVARCTSVLSCSTHENAAAVDTMMFHSSHSLDMKFSNIESNGEFHLGYSNRELKEQSWYQMIHPEDVCDAIQKHQELTRCGFDTSKSVCVRMQTSYGHFIWLHIIMRISTPVGVDSIQQEITCLNHVISEKEAYETKNRENWEEIMSLSNGNTLNFNQAHGQTYLPTVVVEEGFFEDPKVEVCTKPVECTREELIKRIRVIAQEKGNVKKAKRARYEVDSSSLDSHSSSSASSESFHNVTFNQVIPQNIDCFSDNQIYQQREPSHFNSAAQPYQYAFVNGFNESIIYNDTPLQSPPTPPYSVASGRSTQDTQDDCMTYINDDTTLSSYSPANHLAQAQNAFCTPPYSPQSDVEEYQPVYSPDDRSFFDSNPPMTKASGISPVKNDSHGVNHYLPEIPCDVVANFFDSFECTNVESSYFDLIDSPCFVETIEMMISSAAFLS